MPVMADDSPRFHNLLEPPAFAALFSEYPPAGFSCEADLSGLPLFFTDFDLLTTLDADVRERLARFPVVSTLARRLKFHTCFAGTTITEYAPVPAGLAPGDLLDGLLQRRGGRQMLTIIKDIPDASPLLPDRDNALASELARAAAERGFFQVEGQALAYLPLDFGGIGGYFAMLSPGRRKDLRRKMRKRDSIDVDVMPIGDPRCSDAAFLDELYAMYLEVYEQSQIHFDLLSPAFFAALLTGSGGAVNGVVVCYRHRGVLVGCNISLIHNGLFIDKYIGLRYPLARDLNLYFVSWVVNLELAMRYGCTAYVAGWTDPQVKAALGAKFTFTRHLVWVKNPVLRRVLRPLRHLFESDSRVMGGKP